jgi:hypothetical protein
MKEMNSQRTQKHENNKIKKDMDAHLNEFKWNTYKSLSGVGKTM